MDKLKKRHKLFYGLGAVSDVLMANIIFQLARKTEGIIPYDPFSDLC